MPVQALQSVDNFVGEIVALKPCKRQDAVLLFLKERWVKLKIYIKQ